MTTTATAFHPGHACWAEIARHRQVLHEEVGIQEGEMCILVYPAVFNALWHWTRVQVGKVEMKPLPNGRTGFGEDTEMELVQIAENDSHNADFDTDRFTSTPGDDWSKQERLRLVEKDQIRKAALGGPLPWRKQPVRKAPFVIPSVPRVFFYPVVTTPPTSAVLKHPIARSMGENHFLPFRVHPYDISIYKRAGDFDDLKKNIELNQAPIAFSEDTMALLNRSELVRKES